MVGVKWLSCASMRISLIVTEKLHELKENLCPSRPGKISGSFATRERDAFLVCPNTWRGFNLIRCSLSMPIKLTWPIDTLALARGDAMSLASI